MRLNASSAGLAAPLNRYRNHSSSTTVRLQVTSQPRLRSSSTRVLSAIALIISGWAAGSVLAGNKATSSTWTVLFSGRASLRALELHSLQTERCPSLALLLAGKDSSGNSRPHRLHTFVSIVLNIGLIGSDSLCDVGAKQPQALSVSSRSTPDFGQ